LSTLPPEVFNRGFCCGKQVLVRRVHVFIAYPTAAIRKEDIRRLVRHVLRKEHVQQWELTIVFIGDRDMRRLNREFLHHRGTTDVISFPLTEGNVVEAEVYVNVEQARRQAREFRVRVGNELRRLVVHGVLHAVGYDDRTDVQRSNMRSLEDTYIQWKNR
jgi:rRNA maturation RNase YbeY